MEIHTVGGYEKVGGNMSAIEVGDEIVIFDMGADIERIVETGENIEELKTVEAIEHGIVPNDSRIKERRDDVVGIVIGHGHQDHCRGVSKLAGAYDCPIIATPYTADIIQRFIENDGENVTNDIIEVNTGESLHVSNEFELEMVPITHSIPHSALTVLRTSEGNIVYSLDFKLDEDPTLGDPVNYQKIKELGEEGVKVYIVDCTRCDEVGKTKPEAHAKRELEGILSNVNKNNGGVIVTTFSSHIARLRNIIAANDDRRKVVMLGRSLKEYTKDAERNGLMDLSDIKVSSYREEVENTLEEVSRKKSDYLLVTTGNQGEPNAMLSRIANRETPYRVSDEDLVIFSSVTIPTPANELNREFLKRKLKQAGAKLKVDVHSHGHAMTEDHRQMMRMLKPDNVIPAHGGKEKQSACARLAREEGIENVHISRNGGVLSID
ncbi:hypothetical protein AKJ51_04330 [candidate division MSBL1 archaeon SCGC-AAA382A20]|uniref:Metallo-beta-lactamase domain-containing protein n=1 Tax=candidate division MSBL1 archaeon SCGC-AAA382A20 TaxID=1698280 RepID=A0A133VHX3_9EURY|nr:hypothetical protein AKJ51_04330 [candidate division MSBL1 archaeon SCGC-AAA382A20]